MSDRSSHEEQSDDGGELGRLLAPLAVGAAVAATVVAGRKLLEQRHRHDNDGPPADWSADDAAERPADLETELRDAASELALTLLERATNRLERAQV